MASAQRGNKQTRIRLPLHLKWSGPVEYDLSDDMQKRYVYEIVLREGGDRDIREFIDPDALVEMWDQLVIPFGVRTAWANWFRIKRGIDLSTPRDGIS